MSRRLNGKIAALDIGSSKIACFIADNQAGELVIQGIGHQLSQGFRAGSITDIRLLETSILSAVHSAEQMADESIENVVVNISTSLIESSLVEVDVATISGKVTGREINRVKELARSAVSGFEREIIHAIPVDFMLDEISGISDPMGMLGKQLTATVHVATVSDSVVRNIKECLSRCHLNVDGIALSSYASGIASLSEDELDAGTTIIDFGGGATSFSIFSRGRMVYTGAVPVGGMHITADIAQGLSTSTASAERVKALYGSALSNYLDAYESVEVQAPGRGDGQDTMLVPRSKLIEIIIPRVEETLEMVKCRLEESEWFNLAGRRIVLTGGASQLTGLKELAAKMFGVNAVRIGRPKPVRGLAEATGSPAFSTCVGLLLGQWNELHTKPEAIEDETSGNRIGGKLVKWFTENF